MSRERAIAQARVRALNVDTGRIEVMVRGAMSERHVEIGERTVRLVVRERKTKRLIMPYLYQYNPKKHEHPLDYFKGTFR